MILSHRHRFIFVKTRKTAGTSVEISLSRYCGPDDVITPITPEDEKIRRELGLAPQNYSKRCLPRRRRHLRELTRGAWPTESVFHNHITASEIVTRVPEWNSYFKFTIVRNPWDYVASRHAWEVYRRHDPTLTVDQVLAAWDPAQNWYSYTLDGKVAVDFAIRFESLGADLAIACRQLGIEFDEWLPRAKANTGRKLHYRELLEPRHVEYVRDRCAAEIDHFGYEF